MKKTTLAIAAVTVLAAQAFSVSAFAQSATGPATGDGNGTPAAAGTTAKPSKAERKAAGAERRAAVKKSNKAGEIPSPSVAPKSY